MKIFDSLQLGKSIGATCQKCAYFRNDPAVIEDAYPGLTIMSSGFASVRDQDGFCDYNELYLSAGDSCPHFVSRTSEFDQGDKTIID
ncbi:MAG: hypothetical protein JWQ34_3369 [Mucilaginibacter sp.]|jgi:hypothetical protein|nr:hypothetical protein [Mucilaginibacter sp.]